MHFTLDACSCAGTTRPQQQRQYRISASRWRSRRAGMRRDSAWAWLLRTAEHAQARLATSLTRVFLCRYQQYVSLFACDCLLNFQPRHFLHQHATLVESIFHPSSVLTSQALRLRSADLLASGDIDGAQALLLDQIARVPDLLCKCDVCVKHSTHV